MLINLDEVKIKIPRAHKYIKPTNPQSAVYTLHVLNHQRQYGPIQETRELITPARKSTRMSCLESYYIQTHQQKDLLVEEQNIGELNPLYNKHATFHPHLHVWKQTRCS